MTVPSQITQVAGNLRDSMWGVARSWRDLLYPPRCAWCDADTDSDGPYSIVCEECRKAIRPKEWVFCGHCGGEITAASATGRCGACRKSRLHFDQVVPLGPYRDDFRKVILRMKNDRRHVVSGAAGRLYCEDRAGLIAAAAMDVVVPVPMHWSRRLARGTNGPEVLASRLSTHVGVELVDRVVFRQRNTRPQAKLKPNERFRNVRGAFGLRAGYDWGGQSVLLVDDILTTGATCSEVARILKEAGASRVVVAVLARAEGLRTTAT